LDVLRILDLPAGVIVLTKCDVAEPDWLSLVEEEVRELVRGTFLQDAPLVRTSAVTGQGMEALCDALRQAAAVAASSPRARMAVGPFRMAIDRSFTIAGHGTVVTGSISSGSARVGDSLVIEPGSIEVRVRSLQNHAVPGFLVPSRLITARVQMLATAARPLRHRQRVRLHMGTAEVLANVSLATGDPIAPGQSGWVQLFLSSPVVATWDQPFVLRAESPVTTIAGGRVLVPDAERMRRIDAASRSCLSDLQSPDPVARVGAALYFAKAERHGVADLARTAGVEQAEAALQTLVDQGQLVVLSRTGQRRVRSTNTSSESPPSCSVYTTGSRSKASSIDRTWPVRSRTWADRSCSRRLWNGCSGRG
jgi:selenocysteine-specific elongation factor